MNGALLRSLVELRFHGLGQLRVLRGGRLLVKRLQGRFRVEVALGALLALPNPFFGGLDVRHEFVLLALRARGAVYHAGVRATRYGGSSRNGSARCSPASRPPAPRSPVRAGGCSR